MRAADRGQNTPRVLLTSFLVGLLKHAGRLCAPGGARAFLRRAGREREIFLPFFYRWFDQRRWAEEQALRLMRAAVQREGMLPPRVFHAPFTGRYGPLLLRYRRDLADPRCVREHGRALARECAFFGRVRREFGIAERIVYTVHLGRCGGGSRSASLQAAAAALEAALPAAREAGVVLALENCADRWGDDSFLGSRLTEVGEVLRGLGAGPEESLGFTFDVAHALLAYRGRAEAVAYDLRPLQPYLVHLHINAPRLSPPSLSWGDRHEAPPSHFPSLWGLFRLGLQGLRAGEFGNVTYEVNWAAPWANPLVGGSRLAEVESGYDRVRRVAAEEWRGAGEFDAEREADYAGVAAATRRRAAMRPEGT